MYEKAKHFCKPEICYFCKTKVEDEYHFIMECKKYVTSRHLLFESISDNVTDFDNLSENDKFILIMKEPNYALAVSKYIYDNLTIRINFVNA